MLFRPTLERMSPGQEDGANFFFVFFSHFYSKVWKVSDDSLFSMAYRAPTKAQIKNASASCFQICEAHPSIPRFNPEKLEE